GSYQRGVTRPAPTTPAMPVDTSSPRRQPAAEHRLGQDPLSAQLRSGRLVQRPARLGALHKADDRDSHGSRWSLVDHPRLNLTQPEKGVLACHGCSMCSVRYRSWDIACCSGVPSVAGCTLSRTVWPAATSNASGGLPVHEIRAWATWCPADSSIDSSWP